MAAEDAGRAAEDEGGGVDRHPHPQPAPFFVPRGVLSTSETCYFGAVLQALAASPSVVAYFRGLKAAIGAGGAYADADDASDAAAPLALAVARLIEQLSTPPPTSPTPVDPSAALGALSKHHRDFAAAFETEGEHQDAAEALEALLNASAAEARAWLRRDVALLSPGLAAVLPSDEDEEEEEGKDEEGAMAAPSVPPPQPSAIPPHPPCPAPRALAEAAAKAAAAAAAAAAPAATSEQPDSEVLEVWRALASPPLEGQLLHLRACLSCGNRAERALAPFFVLPLPVPASSADDTTNTNPVATVRPGATLDHCMRLFTAQELLSGVRCARCDLRRVLQGAERAAALVLPPPSPAQAEARRELAALAAGGGGGGGGALADDDVVDLRALARRAGLPLGLERGGGGGREGLATTSGGNSNSNSSALRQTVICRAPAVLALQLLRARPGQRKLHGRIAYPPLLDLCGFVLAGEERAAAAAAAAAAGDALAAAAAPSLLYELVAVVQHLGLGTGRGHYVTYRRVGGGNGGGWVRANDARVDRCEEQEALSCDGAALLVYERVDLFGIGGGAGLPLVGGGGGG